MKRRFGAALLAAALCAACSGPRATPSRDASASTAASTSSPSQPRNPDRPTAPLPDVDLPGIVSPLGDSLDAYAHQSLAWSACGTLQCATVRVPEDYARPGWRAVTLTVRRRPPAGGASGTIFVNPGGPGEPTEGILKATSLVQALGTADLVGVDSRGTEASTPVVCYDHQDRPVEAISQQLALDTSPNDDAAFAALDRSQADFANACAQHSGSYLRYVGLEEQARDMDLVRGLLGIERVIYVGWSYGTLLGARYATIFPDRVDRMVLDGVPQSTTAAAWSSHGFERAINAFASASTGLGLGDTADDVLRSIRQLLDGLQDAPMTVNGRHLTQSEAAAGIEEFLYRGARGYPPLRSALLDARRGDGSALLAAADAFLGRSADGTVDERFFALPAIYCVDNVDAGVAGARRQWQDAARSEPTLGAYIGPELTCAHWPVASTMADPGAHLAIPPLVIGTTGDPATPYENAEILSRQVGGVELTYQGTGHTGTASGNPCVTRAVAAYLADGTLPAGERRCTGD